MTIGQLPWVFFLSACGGLPEEEADCGLGGVPDAGVGPTPEPWCPASEKFNSRHLECSTEIGASCYAEPDTLVSISRVEDLFSTTPPGCSWYFADHTVTLKSPEAACHSADSYSIVLDTVQHPLFHDGALQSRSGYCLVTATPPNKRPVLGLMTNGAWINDKDFKCEGGINFASASQLMDCCLEEIEVNLLAGLLMCRPGCVK